MIVYTVTTSSMQDLHEIFLHQIPHDDEIIESEKCISDQ